MTKQDYANALSLACRYLLNVCGEERCRLEVARLRAGLLSEAGLRLGGVEAHEALLADALERLADASAYLD